MLSRAIRNAVLCYVHEPWGSAAGSPPTAYFTTQPLAGQWGDDWNDAPYDCNAGIPYTWHARRYTKQPDGSHAWEPNPEPPWRIFMVEFTGPFETPRGVAFNTPYSVEMINGGKIPWLWTETAQPEIPVVIPAGVTFSVFRKRVRRAGGTVGKPEEVPGRD
jgi:hypothetical protein